MVHATRPDIATRAVLTNTAQPQCNINTITLSKIVDGQETSLASGTFSADGSGTVKVKIYDDSGSHRFKVWVDGTLEINTTNSTFLYGGVAFGGPNANFDNCKIGYDQNSDDDIDDPTDDIVWSDDFGGTSRTPVYDHAGNLIDDGTFVYVYDAWNRLIKARAKEDADVTIQTAEFDGLGRRIKKVVSNSGDYDKTDVYFYDGQRIVQINNGSGTMVQQFIHGTQYIDELVMMRVKDKGDLYVHQDANWNVIGTTDLGRHVVERSVYTPYGELTIHQDTGFGDRDGDHDVDSTDKGTVGTTCTGTVGGSCRIIDLDFDGDYDSTDATKFDALSQGAQRHPGRPSTNVSQPFAHQGLLLEPELGQYSTHRRQFDPTKRRWLQPTTTTEARMPASVVGVVSAYLYANGNPLLAPASLTGKPAGAPIDCYRRCNFYTSRCRREWCFCGGNFAVVDVYSCGWYCDIDGVWKLISTLEFEEDIGQCLPDGEACA